MVLLEAIYNCNPTFVLISIAVISLVIYKYLRSSDNAYNLPPGPKPWPIIGNLPELAKNRQFFKLFLEYKKKYGDLFTVYIGPEPTVVLGSLGNIREGLIEKKNEFAGRPQTFTGELITANKDIALGQYGEEWKRQRKIAYTAMRKYATGEHLEKLVEESFSKVKVILDQKAESGEAFNPMITTSLLIYNIIAAMTLGKVYELDDPFFKTIIQLIEEFVDVVGDGLLADLWPILKYIPTAATRVLKRFSAAFNGHIDMAIKEHQENYDPAHVTDFTYHLLEEMETTEKEEGQQALAGLTSVHFRGILIDIFSAGTDTSRFTMLWALLYLANHPDIQAKAQQEIDSTIEDGVRIRTDIKSKLPYLDAVLHEVMRIRTLVPLALPHVTMEDVTIGDYRLPKGTQVLPFLWALHMDPTYWDEPEEFRPERFLDENGQLAPRISNWMPFSTGRRVCVGESVAKVELLLSLAYFLKRYTFKPPKGQKIKPDIKPLGTFVMPEPYDLVVERRT